MRFGSFERAQRLCGDVRKAKHMIGTFQGLAAKALASGHYEDAAVCLENAAMWSRLCHEAGYREASL